MDFDPSSAQPVEGFDPGTATPVREVGGVESALRTVGTAARKAVGMFDMAAVGLASIFGDEAAVEDTLKIHETRQKGMKDFYDPKPDEEFSTAGQIVGGAVAAPIELVGGLGAQHGVERATEVIDRGGSLGQARKAGAVSAGVHGALNLVPVKAGGMVGKAVESKVGGLVGGALTGGGLAAGTGAAGRAAENAALPEGEQFKDLEQPALDGDALAVDAGLGAMLGAIPGARSGKKAKAEKQAKIEEAAGPLPRDQLTDLGGGDFRAPNGATITEAAWENSSKKVREGWMKAEDKVPVGEATELPNRPADTSDLQALKEEHPSGPVAEVLAEVEAARHKDAAKSAETLRAKADAAELRKVAAASKDPLLQEALRKRADKLDPPEKIAKGEVIEGQPEIKVDQPKKIPVGEVKEGQPDLPDETPKKPLPKADVVAEYPAGHTAVRKEDAPDDSTPAVPEVKELFVDPKRGGGKLPVGEATEVEMLPVGEVKEGQPELPGEVGPKKPIPKGEATEQIPVGEVVEDVPKIPVGEAKDLGDAATPVEQVPVGEAKELYVPPKVEAMLKDDGKASTSVEIRKTADGYEAYADGKKVGRLASNLTPEQSKQLNERASIDIVKVDKEHQGKGYGRALYDAWAKDHEGRIEPSGKTTADAWKVWKRNYPEKVDAFVDQEAARIRGGADAKMVVGNITDPEIAQRVTTAASAPAPAKPTTARGDRFGGKQRGFLLISNKPHGPKPPPKPPKPVKVRGKNGRYELSEESKTELVERKMMDRFNRVLKLNKAEPPKSEDADIYLADQLYAGRAQSRGDAFEKEFIKPLGDQLEAAKESGLSVKDADDYLMALHAPERNAVIAARNPKMADGGSGLTNKQAKEIVDGYTPAQRKHLDAIAKTVHTMNRKKLDALVDDGLITAESRDRLNQQYKAYVPLKTLDEEAEFTGVGRGYELRGSDITTALGRSSKASSPIAASVMDATRSIMRGEKARVDKAIWNYAKDTAGSDYIRPYDENKPPKELMGRKIGPDGQVKEIVDSQKVQDMTISLMVDGKQQRVFVPDEMLRDQLRKVATTNDPGPFLAAVGRGTGTIGRLLTEFNPAFTAPNAVRDAITVALRTGAHEGLSTAKVMAGIPKAWRSIYNHKRGANSPDARLYEEFLQTGGKTGAYGIKGVTDTMRDLERAGADLGYAEHMKGSSRRQLTNALRAAAKMISSANEVLEYASRFSVYKEARAAGYTPKKAAAVAKEITVNFNRSGEYGRTLNSVFVFANAALQGLRNSIVYAKNPHVQRGMIGLVALGAASQMYNELVGGENEETGEPNINSQNDASADKNVTVLAPGSKSGVKIPLPPEYAMFFAIGRRAYRAVTQQNYSREAAGIAGVVLDATLPVRIPDSDSGALSVAKAMTPTLAAPFVDIWTNQNYFGAPVVPKQRNENAPAPYHTLSRSTTSDIAKGVSEIANAATGGDDVTPGKFQGSLGRISSPEGIEHLVGFYTGGVGQLAMQSKNLAVAATGGKPVDTNKIPIANRFVFAEPKSYIGRRYRELQPELEYAKKYDRTGGHEKIGDKAQRALSEYEATEKELTALFKELRDAEGSDREAVEQQIKRAQARVIKAYNGQPQ
jgi:molybdenum-dependent DNA-binding transcriptional regulator ModE/GNAT superfamily N-acetyltransferase